MNIKEYIKEVKQNAIHCQNIIEETIFNTIDWQLDENEFANGMSDKEYHQFRHEIAQQIIKNIYKTIQ